MCLVLHGGFILLMTLIPSSVFLEDKRLYLASKQITKHGCPGIWQAIDPLTLLESRVSKNIKS